MTKYSLVVSNPTSTEAVEDLDGATKEVACLDLATVVFDDQEQLTHGAPEA